MITAARPWVTIISRLAAGACLCVWVSAAFAAETPGKKAEPEGFVVLGVAVKPLKGYYLVSADLNIRAQPQTKGKKIGRAEKGEALQVIGDAPGKWLAVRLPDGQSGFAYAPVLIPVIDGKIDQDLSGTIKVSGDRVCEYTIRFDSRTEVEGQLFRSADYMVWLRCLDEGPGSAPEPLIFTVPMFITEGPFNGSRNPVYQVGIDLLELAGEYDRFFSTNLIYDRGKSEVRYDNTSIKQYAVKPDPSTRHASGVAEALSGALDIALASWTNRTWTVLGAALSGEDPAAAPNGGPVRKTN